MRCSGVNFRDVQIALGYPADYDVGLEGSGVILEFAHDVTGFAAGDRVMGQFNGAGPVVVADSRRIVRIPSELSDAEAATIPAGFLTAYYALAHLAHVKAGERVLVHAATGGLGMAAVQLARHWGLDVYATASPGKWDILRGMGFADDHIASSRTTDFEQKFTKTTGGAGMDVVLDCLKDEFVDASLRLLPNGGRFIELGRADVRDPAKSLRTIRVSTTKHSIFSTTSHRNSSARCFASWRRCSNWAHCARFRCARGTSDRPRTPTGC